VSARVEVRIEDFKAFIAKLAEGSIPVGPDIYPKIASGEAIKELEVQQKQNAKDILIKSIIQPLTDGTAVDILVENANIDNDNALVVPVTINIKSAFMQNIVQTLDSIAVDKKVVNAKAIDNLCRSGSPEALGEGSVGIYIFGIKSLPRLYRVDTHMYEVKRFYREARGYTMFFTPDILVSLVGSDGVIAEHLFPSKLKSNYDDGSFSIFGNYWDWSNMHLVYQRCVQIAPSITVKIGMKLSSSDAKKLKTIEVKMINQ